MSVKAVAIKDFKDGIRSRLLWGLMALFFVSVTGFTYLATRGGVDEAGEGALLATLGFSAILAIVVLIPVTGLVVSIKSIVREREMGSIRILLSLPHTRGEVVLGKFIGRSGLLASAILVGFVPAAGILFIRIGEFPILELVVFLLTLILFGVIFVGIGIAVSAFMRTETRATVAGIGIFFLFYFWDSIFQFINNEIGLLSGNALTFVLRFDLFIVFLDAFNALLALDQDVDNTTAADTAAILGAQQNGEAIAQPFYLQHWFAFIILALWLTVPLAIGYLRFQRIDL